MINLWCPFRKGLQDVMCIFYLPSAVLHQLGTQALQNWFLMKCRVDLLTPPSWWGKIYPFVEGFFTLPAVLGSPGQPGGCESCHSRHRPGIRAGTSGDDAPALMLWTNSPQHLFLPCWATSSHAQGTELTNKRKTQPPHPKFCFTIPLLSFPPWFN